MQARVSALHDTQDTGDPFYLAAMTAQAMPEPGTCILLRASLGATGLVVKRRKPRRRPQPCALARFASHCDISASARTLR